MNQEITLAKSFVKFLYKNSSIFNKSTAKECIEIIKQNKVVLDEGRKISKLYKEQLDDLPYDIRNIEVRHFIVELLEKNKKYIKQDINSELELCNITEDKIYFEPYYSNEEIENAVKRNNEIEYHNSESFATPKLSHRLKIVPYTIKLQNEENNFNEIILPFLKQTKYIEIIDPYLPNANASYNLSNLLDEIRGDVEIKLYYLKKEDYSKSRTEKDTIRKRKEYEEFETKINDRNKNRNIEMDYLECKAHYDRFIFTDKLRIYIPGGFDCIKKDGRVHLGKKDIKMFRIDFKQ